MINVQSINVFISHATNDSEATLKWIQKLEKSLESIGCNVTYDEKLKENGTVMANYMMLDQILIENQFIIAIMTKKYYTQSIKANSGVEKEIRLMAPFLTHTIKKNKIITIKKSRKCKPPKLLEEIIYYDFSDDAKFDSNIEKIYKLIRAGLS